MPKTRGGESAREVDRITGPLDHLVVVAAAQPDRAGAEHVDRRDHVDRSCEPL